MDTRTQSLLNALASDGGRQVIETLRNGPKTGTAIKDEVEIGGTATEHYLALFLAYGLVDYVPKSSGRQGRPTRTWRLVNARKLVRLEKAATDLAGEPPGVSA